MHGLKITKVVVYIEPYDTDTPMTDAPLMMSTYCAVTGQWHIDGPIYPRHLKALAGIASECRDADKGTA